MTITLLLTTLGLSFAPALTVADEFQIFPKTLQWISSILVQYRAFRTLFICCIVTLMRFATTFNLRGNANVFSNANSIMFVSNTGSLSCEIDHVRLVEVTSRLDFLWKRDAGELVEMRETRRNNCQLLQNILPDHVAHHFLAQDRHADEFYSQSRDNVGVMFATNFTEFYSEDVNKGVECIRLLNEIIVDFDELLGESRFRSIEKIKTVDASFMAVSGLNPTHGPEEDEYGHIGALADFALSMNSCLQEVNKHSFNNFQLPVGISCGALVGGVIGARKPVVDVWGNTVNEAFRMDSTGTMGCIQVLKETAKPTPIVETTPFISTFMDNLLWGIIIKLQKIYHQAPVPCNDPSNC